MSLSYTAKGLPRLAVCCRVARTMLHMLLAAVGPLQSTVGAHHMGGEGGAVRPSGGNQDGV